MRNFLDGKRTHGVQICTRKHHLARATCAMLQQARPDATTREALIRTKQGFGQTNRDCAPLTREALELIFRVSNGVLGLRAQLLALSRDSVDSRLLLRE